MLLCAIYADLSLGFRVESTTLLPLTLGVSCLLLYAMPVLFYAVVAHMELAYIHWNSE